MFVGTINEDLRALIKDAVRDWDVQDLYVGCSGNFTIERMLKDSGFRLHGNDTVLGGYGLSITNDTPNGPIELWFRNPLWESGTMFYRVNRDGSLTWTPVDTLSNGWIRFAVTPDVIAQGGNFVMVLPDSVKTLKVHEGLLEWNGIVQTMPTIQGKDGTYSGLFYVMAALKQDGVTSHWNGKTWTLTTSKPLTVQATTGTPKSGDIPVIVNGTTVAYVKGMVAQDGWTKRPTTYVPIDSLDSLLKSLFGTAPDWTNGTH